MSRGFGTRAFGSYGFHGFRGGISVPVDGDDDEHGGCSGCLPCGCLSWLVVIAVVLIALAAVR